MKNWRRTSRAPTPTRAATGPSIIAVVTNGTSNVEISFSAPIVLGGAATSTILINAQVGDWIGTVNATTLLWDDQGSSTHSPAEPWSMPLTDPAVTPNPVAPESGITT